VKEISKKTAMVGEQSHDDIIIHPRREKGEKQLPVKGLFLPNPSEARFGLEEVKKRVAGDGRFSIPPSVSVPKRIFLWRVRQLGLPWPFYVWKSSLPWVLKGLFLSVVAGV